MSIPKIAVLLSSYNGSKYIIQQIDSIINQKGVNFHLFVSDDGSNDNTLDILKDYKKKNFIKEIFKNNFKNPSHNFHFLVNKVCDYEFYAFADQDDIWLEDKLLHAVKSLKDKNADLYCSRTKLIDENNNHIGFSELRKNISFGNSIVQSLAGGNTMVFTSRIAKKFSKVQKDLITSHDWTLYLLSQIFDYKLIYDVENLKVLYRQHSNNVIGDNTSLFSQIARALKVFLGEYKLWIDRNLKIVSIYENILSKQNKDILKKFIILKERQKFFNYKNFKKQGIMRNGKFSNLKFYIAYLFKKI